MIKSVRRINLLLPGIMLIMISCNKDQEIDSDFGIKHIGFNSDTIISTDDNHFYFIDYVAAEVVKADKDGIVKFKRGDLFQPVKAFASNQEKPYIFALKKGGLAIWEQVTDSIIPSTKQIYCHWNIKTIDFSGNYKINQTETFNSKKKINPLSVVEDQGGGLIGIGIIETNFNSGAIELMKISAFGASLKKTINPAQYWLNGIFPNARTTIKSMESNYEVYAIIQLGLQTSCFKFDNNLEPVLYRRFSFSGSGNVNNQINAKTIWDCPISYFQRIDNGSFLISGTKFSGKIGVYSYTDPFCSIISDNFDTISVFRYSNYSFIKTGAPIIDIGSGMILLPGGESQEAFDEEVPTLFHIKISNLELDRKETLSQIRKMQLKTGFPFLNSYLLGANSDFLPSGSTRTTIIKLKR
jgi:hypothetical protein